MFGPETASAWRVEYFADQHLFGWPQRGARAPEGHLDMMLEPPGQPLPGERFSARAESLVRLEPGVYEATVESSHASRLWVGASLVVDQRSEIPYRASARFLVGGGEHRFVVETLGSGSASRLKVSWESSAPASVLHLPAIPH